MQCGVCGGTQFQRRTVLWDKLVSDWQLSPSEADYIDRQQGECCIRCGSNLRSIVLANAICNWLGTSAPLIAALSHPRAAELSILEINEAGSLSPVLRKFGRHTFGAYPEVDIHQLPYPNGTFDLVVHSDTLEHVERPIHALSECRRVLKPHGALCFTVPIVVGRMSRSRQGLAPSYHGNSGTDAQDWAVQTEFGADAWTTCFEAGFHHAMIHALEFPAAIAFSARPTASTVNFFSQQP
jgi:SAM-dependent methyltransferase